MTAALVIGKFYPPHAGHLHLLRCALAVRDHVVVLCLGAAGDTYAPAQRLAALLEDAAEAGLDPARILGHPGYDQTPFDLTDPIVWAAHAEVFRAHLTGLPAVDTVVTSEGYGPELAARLGLTHHPCDPTRTAVPISATRLRADLLASWDALGPGTRRMLTARIVLLGAESTGTTTLAVALAERLRTRGGPWTRTRVVEEYGRTLTERKQLQAAAEHGAVPLSVDWTPADFSEVATVQAWSEEKAAAVGGPALICDTDAFATPIWERRYLGAERARLDPSSLGRGDVYLLTHHEGVPFVQDGTRDGSHLRSQMTDDLLAHMVAHNKPFTVLTGTLAQRIALAERITDQAVQRRLTFTQPI